MSMASYIGVAAIETYQRWLSPRKGFRCAYGVLHGSGTCSSIGKRIMREQGVLKFLRLMPKQFAACKAAAASLAAETEEEKHRRKRKREQEREWKRGERRKALGDSCDDCDLPCDGMPEMDCSLGEIDACGCSSD